VERLLFLLLWLRFPFNFHNEDDLLNEGIGVLLDVFILTKNEFLAVDVDSDFLEKTEEKREFAFVASGVDGKCLVNVGDVGVSKDSLSCFFVMNSIRSK
jgi:hypothetical protein